MAIDPGHRKCGLAVVGAECGRLQQAVVERSQLLATVRSWMERWPVECLVVGGSTGSRPVVAELQQAFSGPLQVVDEYGTSQRARLRYFQDHPPRGWWRWVPLGLQVPAVAIDDYAALVMAEDFLAQQGSTEKGQSDEANPL